LREIVVRGDIRLVQESKVWFQVNLALKVSPAGPKQSSDLMLSIEERNAILADSTDRRLKNRVVLKVSVKPKDLFLNEVARL
jgi:hypothetical protein